MSSLVLSANTLTAFCFFGWLFLVPISRLTCDEKSCGISQFHSYIALTNSNKGAFITCMRALSVLCEWRLTVASPLAIAIKCRSHKVLSLYVNNKLFFCVWVFFVCLSYMFLKSPTTRTLFLVRELSFKKRRNYTLT